MIDGFVRYIVITRLSHFLIEISSRFILRSVIIFQDGSWPKGSEFGHATAFGTWVLVFYFTLDILNNYVIIFFLFLQASNSHGYVGTEA